MSRKEAGPSTALIWCKFLSSGARVAGPSFPDNRIVGCLWAIKEVDLLLCSLLDIGV